MEEGVATVGLVLLRKVSEAVVQLPPLPLRVSLFQAMVSFLPTPLPPAVVLIDVGLNFHQERACCCFLHSQKMQNAFQRSLLAALLHFVIWYLFDVFEQIFSTCCANSWCFIAWCKIHAFLMHELLMLLGCFNN